MAKHHDVQTKLQSEIDANAHLLNENDANEFIAKVPYMHRVLNETYVSSTTDINSNFFFVACAYTLQRISLKSN